MEKIKIDILLFGSLKSYFGDNIQISIPKGISTRALIRLLEEKAPGASEILASCQVAVNAEIRKGDFAILQPGEIAILPPFSGG